MRKNDDLISRQAAVELIKNYCENGCDLAEDNWCPSCQREQFIKLLKKLPPAQPERKKGKWTKDCACEICGFKPWYERDIHTLSFCPNCGSYNGGENDQSK